MERLPSHGLVTCDWLADNLADPHLRVFDCTTKLELETGAKRPYRVVSMQDDFDKEHIPGSTYLDLQADFSRLDSQYGMTLRSPEASASAFANAGVDEGSTVVLYSRMSLSWATRFWWMLRWIGFDRAYVLDGGMQAWVGNGYPVSNQASGYPAGKLTSQPRGHLFVEREPVLAATSDPNVRLVCALGRDVFRGETVRYGRPGHIPSSVNVPKVDLIDSDTGCFKPPGYIDDLFRRAGLIRSEPIISYRGGGIFATAVAFWLQQLGYSDIAVYDKSMSEWGFDESLPMCL